MRLIHPEFGGDCTTAFLLSGISDFESRHSEPQKRPDLKISWLVGLVLQDPEDIADRRHLLRLWVSPKHNRPIPEEFAALWDSTIPGERGGIFVKGALTVPLDAEWDNIIICYHDLSDRWAFRLIGAVKHPWIIEIEW